MKSYGAINEYVGGELEAPSKFIKIFIFLALFSGGFLITNKVEAANCGVAGSAYYISAAGSDSNNGTASTTPWLHHPWDSNKSGNANCALQAGDTVYMRRGDTWYNTSLAAAQAGSSGNQILTTSTSTFYKTSTSDPLPKLSGAYDPSTLTWAQDGANNDWYVSGTNPIASAPNIVVFNDTVLVATSSQAIVRTTTNSFWYDSTNKTVYVNVGGASPASGICEVGKQNYVYLNSQGYQTLSYLELRVANTTVGAIAFNNGFNSVIFDHDIFKGFHNYAVYQYSSSNDQVTNSSISEGTSAATSGIYLNIVTNSLVSGNTVSGISSGHYPTGSGFGIYVYGASSGDTITKNLLNNNYIGIGILIYAMSF